MRTSFNRILAFAALTLNGCSGVAATVLKQAPAKPLDCKFDVYVSDSEVPKKFETLCLIEAHTGQGWIHDKTISGAIDEARPRVCECGADAAIIVDGSSKQSSDWTATIFTPSRELRGNVKLKAIRFVP
jgi:hypothetical protein